MESMKRRCGRQPENGAVHKRTAYKAHESFIGSTPGDAFTGHTCSVSWMGSPQMVLFLVTGRIKRWLSR